ncbi:MAG: hypothetical protein K0S43_381 [Cellulosimicrobium sp.]|nr:hypothetical protein [Cellulosimicrobium sp.]
MDSNQYATAIVRAINIACEESGISTNALALASGVPRTSLIRKLSGHGDLTVRETANIAAALGVPIARLTHVKGDDRTPVAVSA